MTFANDIDSDISAVFFDDFAQNGLLVRASNPVDQDAVGIRFIVEVGLDRFNGEGYTKNSWEVTVQVSDRIVKGDIIRSLDENGVVINNYLVGDIAQREGAVLIFGADKKRA